MSDDRTNVVAPDGDVISLPNDQIAEATNPDNGYHLASPDEVSQHFKEETFGSVPQQALTAVEGIGEGVAGPLFTAAERATGLTTPENMLARRQVNPVTHGLGQVAGLVGSSAIGLGEGALLGKAGAVASKALGLAEPASALAKVGSSAVKAATEMALFQGGDETSKMIMNDPETSFQSAIANVGLAAALGAGVGGALGSVNPLWEATAGPKLTKFVEDFGNRIKQHLDGTSFPSVEANIPEAPSEVELSSGQKMADKIMENGLSKISGKTMGAAAGALIGGPGSRALGALIGEHALGPFFDSILSSVAKPMLEQMADGPALKSAIDYSIAVIKGQKIVNAAVKNVFKSGGEVLSSNLIPDEKDRAKIVDRIDEIKQDPQRQFIMKPDRFAHYLPAHGGARGSTLGATFEYLDSLQPKPKKLSLMDQTRQPSKAEKANFDNALDIAQQPALIFAKIKNGSITGRDVQQLQTIYPAFYKMASQKLAAEMAGHIAKDEPISYQTRVGISKFLGFPLDSTMSPQSIQAAQMATGAQQGGPPQQGQSQSGDLDALKKSANMLASRNQSSEERHQEQF